MKKTKEKHTTNNKCKQTQTDKATTETK